MPSLGQKGKGISSLLNLSALEQFSYDYIILLDQSEWMILHVWLPSPSNIYRYSLCDCVTMQSFNFTRYHSKQVGENTLPSSYIFYEALKFLLHFESYIFKHYGRIFSNFPLSWLCPACVAVSSPLCSARSNFQLIISELSNPKIFMTDIYVRCVLTDINLCSSIIVWHPLNTQYNVYWLKIVLQRVKRTMPDSPPPGHW